MAQQEEPLYDFPEPAQPTPHKFAGHKRSQSSLRSISVLDRLLLTVPVWVQLSINPATALHILQREPPGTFLVRKSRTYRRNVLCLRLADDSVPSFVQQFGIREEQTTFCLETSVISFPDLPRLISFYCVSRDVLPFPLELPEAIAKATSHKELESISHMGIEFWNSHLNVRGPRETPRAPTDHGKLEGITPALPSAAPQISSAAQPAPQLDTANQGDMTPQVETEDNQSEHSATLFREFCPITTRSPRDLDCGSGLGALCFINPLFLQSQVRLSRQRLFKRSLKVRVSTENSTFLLPPLAPPPPPPLIPKSKGRCKVKTKAQQQPGAQPNQSPGLSQGQNTASANQPSLNDPTAPDTQLQSLSKNKDIQSQSEDADTVTQVQPQTQTEAKEAAANQQKPRIPTVMDHLPEDSDYMQPSPRVNVSLSPLLSPYLCPSVPPKAPPSLFPKVSPSLVPHDSPGGVPSLSPYQSPSPSPCTCPSFFQHGMDEYHTPTTPLRRDEERKEREAEEEGGGEDDNKDEIDETVEERLEDREEDMDLIIQQMCATSLTDIGSCSSLSSLEEVAETPPPSHPVQNNDASQ
ncbi:uncharacterized protein LOC143014691 [Genypterus blacodes]|uniref:uncharacterized protein LOC143014691 n=1 Tax=Genypterus blacodes TaxID=154954 RepID=UPI003F76F472